MKPPYFSYVFSTFLFFGLVAIERGTHVLRGKYPRHNWISRIEDRLIIVWMWVYLFWGANVLWG